MHRAAARWSRCASHGSPRDAAPSARAGHGPAQRPEPQAANHVDLHHHGDAEIASHLVDFAVNVRSPGPPAWLAEAIEATTRSLGSYPRPAAAIAAVARRHQRPAEQVLLTAGGAEVTTRPYGTF